jgi:hypothetical protein
MIRWPFWLQCLVTNGQFLSRTKLSKSSNNRPSITIQESSSEESGMEYKIFNQYLINIHIIYKNYTFRIATITQYITFSYTNHRISYKH